MTPAGLPGPALDLAGRRWRGHRDPGPEISGGRTAPLPQHSDVHHRFGISAALLGGTASALPFNPLRRLASITGWNNLTTGGIGLSVMFARTKRPAVSGLPCYGAAGKTFPPSDRKQATLGTDQRAFAEGAAGWFRTRRRLSEDFSLTPASIGVAKRTGRGHFKTLSFRGSVIPSRFRRRRHRAASSIGAPREPIKLKHGRLSGLPHRAKVLVSPNSPAVQPGGVSHRSAPVPILHPEDCRPAGRMGLQPQAEAAAIAPVQWVPGPTAL